MFYTETDAIYFLETQASMTSLCNKKNVNFIDKKCLMVADVLR